jgi:hydrogenase-4 component E
MTYLLVAFLAVVIAPLLTASWRLHLVGLGLQGLIMTALVAQRGWTGSPADAVLLLDLLVLRTWFVPRHLFAVMGRPGGPAGPAGRVGAAGVRADVIPANLLSWALAGALVLVSFHAAALLVPAGGPAAIQVAVAASGLLRGLLVLGTQVSTFAQIVGVLRVEYAIALFELGGGHQASLPVQLGLTVALLLSVLTLGAFLRRLGAAGPDQPQPRERAT